MAKANKNVNARNEIAAEKAAIPVLDAGIGVQGEKPTLSMGTMIPVVSMVRKGKLIYASKRTIGYEVEWGEFGDTQFIELGELVAMKSSDSKLFSENMIAIPDTFELKNEVLKYLHVDRYYENAPDPYGIDKLFVLEIGEMETRVRGMSASMRDAVKETAKAAIQDGTLDSIKRIRALEAVLDCKLT